MNKSYPFPEIQEKLSSAQKLMVALPGNPRYDQMAGALALGLALQQAGKSASVVCPSPMTVEFHNLVGVDKVAQKANGRDLVVSLSYSMDEVEKISYNDDNGRLNLVIQPKAEAPELSEKSVSFSHTGAEAELVITIGVKSLDQLNSAGLGAINPEKVINIDNRLDNTNFALINVIDVDSSSISEVIFGLLSGLGLPVDIDTSQNLLNGLWQSSSGLQKPDLGADVYEAVAGCLRLGAQKPKEVASRPLEFQSKPTQTWPKQKTWPVREERKAPPVENQVTKNPPADWFEPKIYKSSSNV